MTAAWHERMLDLYRRLDSELAAAGGQCRGCGECCHFDQVDHVLYASELERRLLAATTAPADPDASPDLLAAGLRCPYQKDSRCLAREGRALGCRLHFCEWTGVEDRGEELAERWHRYLKELHDELGVEWSYRPLLPLEPQ